jgi:hypothetical protein
MLTIDHCFNQGCLACSVARCFSLKHNGVIGLSGFVGLLIIDRCVRPGQNEQGKDIKICVFSFFASKESKNFGLRFRGKVAQKYLKLFVHDLSP